MTPNDFYFLDMRYDHHPGIYRAELVTPGGNLYLVHPVDDSSPAARSYLSREYVALRLEYRDWHPVPKPPATHPQEVKHV